MCKALIKGAFLGGVILFAWSSISWMVMPWHKTTMHDLKDSAAVARVLKTNTPQSGVYLVGAESQNPQQTTAPSKNSSKPALFAFISVDHAGMAPMNQTLLIEFIGQLVAAFLVTWLLLQTAGLNYFQRVVFVFVFALAAGILADVPYWNWFRFSQDYTLVALADLLIGWTLAGLAIAKIAR